MPGPEQNADLAAWRQRAPETPHVGPLTLFVRGVGKCVRLDMTGIHPFVEQIDRLALTGPIDPADHDDHGKTPLLRKVILSIDEILTQFWNLAIIRLLVDLVPQFCRFKHGS